MKCFFNDCKKEVNQRDKLCEKKEREAAADIAAIFANAEKKAA